MHDTGTNRKRWHQGETAPSHPYEAMLLSNALASSPTQHLF